MAEFDAGEVIEGLSYDFTKYQGGKGPIPEPTSAQLRAFGRFMQDAARREQDRLDAQRRWLVAANAAQASGDPCPPQPQLPAEDEQRVIEDVEAEALAAVCSGQPSKDDILRLPSRLQRAFWGYVVGHFMDPTVSTAAMRPSRAARTVDAPASS